MPYAIAMLLLAATLAGRGGADTVVAIRGFGFRPGSVTVPVGSRVVWTNEDDIAHTVSFADTAARMGGALSGKGDSLSVRFTAPGRYAYVCARHPFMTGDVLVTPNTEDRKP
jgi:plastocyanin